MFDPRYNYNNGLLKPASRRAAAVTGHRGKRGMVRRAFNDLQNSGLFGAGGAGHQLYSPAYERAEDPSVVEQFLPTDTQTQNKMFRNILMTDPVAAPAISFYQDLCFGNRVLLGGIQDSKILQIYNDAIEASGIVEEMPWLLHDFLGFGRAVAAQWMDPSKGFWTSTTPLDPDYYKLHMPPLGHLTPIIDWQPNNDEQAWALLDDPRAQDQRDELNNDDYVMMLRSGQPVPLEPQNTIFLPRRAFASDRYGSSLLTRILPYKVYEKAIMDASVIASRRRAGPVWIVTVPENYEAGEIREIIDQLFAAEEDPIAAKVGIREGVTIQPLGGGSGDFWTIREEYDFLRSAKMTALGISDSFLTGEATYSSMDKVLHVFLEKLRSVRRLFTNRIITNHMLRTLARIHGFTNTTTQAHLSHRIRVSKKTITDADLMIPTVEWDRPLEPMADLDRFDMLERLEAKGIVIPMKSFAQAANYDLDEALENKEAEIKLRDSMLEFKRAIIEQAEEHGFSADGEFVGESSTFGGGGLFGEPEGDLFGGGGGFDFGEPGEGAGLDLGPPADLELSPEAPGGGAGGGLPAPAGPLEGPGAGASGEKARFVVPRASPRLRTADPYYSDLEEALLRLPFWDRAHGDVAFGMPVRACANLIDKISHTDPKRRNASMFHRFRRDGLNTLQSDFVQYLAVRLGYLDRPRIEHESLKLMQRYLVDRAETEGLTPLLNQEIDLLSAAFADRDVRPRIGVKNLVSREANIPDQQLLTGVDT